MIEQLEKELARRRKVHIQDEHRTLSAVLVPLFVKQNKYHLLFIQRTDRVRYHKGQVSFPGGAYEKEDKDLLTTALREAEEEIGLERNQVRILGELDDMATIGTKYIIAPFVGLIPYPYDFKVDHFETEEILEIPLTEFLDKNTCEEGTSMIEGKSINSYFYHCHGVITVWGATARIVRQFAEILNTLQDKGVSIEPNS
jgi:8-oxo-dGTP pyrophosphatase MutT (NUDIX family)